MTKKESLKRIIKSFEFDEVVRFWNNYSQEFAGGEDDIYENEDWAIDKCFPQTSEFARASRYGHYDYEDKYFYINHYGNLFSFNDINDGCCPIKLDKLADYLIENGDSMFPIDDDDLIDDFLGEYFHDTDECDRARRIIEDLGQYEPMDFLMDEWDNLNKDISAHWQEYK